MKNVITSFAVLLACGLLFSFINLNDSKKNESSYSFNKKIVYKFTDKKENSNNITYCFGEEGNIMSSYGDNESVSILDMKNQVSITLDEERKSAIVMSTKVLGKLIAGGASKPSTATVTKTGNTKDILGYSCEEYLIVDKKSKAEIWITEEITMDYTEIANGFAKWTKQKINPEMTGSNGFMMEMTSYDKKGAIDSHILITEYEEVETTVELSNYEVTTMSIGL